MFSTLNVSHKNVLIYGSSDRHNIMNLIIYSYLHYVMIARSFKYTRNIVIMISSDSYILEHIDVICNYVLEHIYVIYNYES